MVTLGCARNEVDSEELAARLEDGGWQLADDTEDASVVLVNTCGFIQAAKQESIDELLDASAGGAHVVAAGCLAERYGSGLAEAMPEAQILSFDDYEDIAARLDSIAAGSRWGAHEPRDRRRLLPLSPTDRPGGKAHQPGHGQIADLPPGVAPASGPRVLRRRLRRQRGGATRRSPPGATVAARSARFRRSAAHSCPAARRICWLRLAGSPITALVSCSW